MGLGCVAGHREAGRNRDARRRDAEGFEQLPHAGTLGRAGFDEPGQRRIDVLRLNGRGTALQGRRPLADAEVPQEAALGNRAINVGAGRRGGPGQAGKIDLRREIGFTGFVQRIDEKVSLHGLQGFGKGRHPIAVVDHEGGPSVVHEPCRQRLCHLLAGKADFQHGTLRRRECDGRLGFRRQAEREAIGRWTRPHEAFMPAAGAMDVVAHRQAIEELVGQDEGRTGRHGIERIVPSDGASAGRERFALRFAQDGARLDEVEIDGVEEGRQAARGPQRIGQERPAARSELDEAHRRRCPQGLPDRGGPGADELAEHLARLRGRREISRGAEGIARPVIA